MTVISKVYHIILQEYSLARIPCLKRIRIRVSERGLSLDRSKI